MSDAFWVSLFGTLTVLITVLLKGRQSDNAIAENTQITKETKAAVTNGLSEAVEEVHQQTNSMHDKLVEATAAMEFAKGVLAGRSQIIEEQKAKE